MERLDHPQIVKVILLTHCPYGFFMDYIDGPNLRALGPYTLDVEKMLSILLGVAETLSHAHSRNVIHRDIKPENIIAVYDHSEDSWTPHLTDFDLAWFSTATQFTKEGIGTLAYAAPEQLYPRNKLARSETVDIYAFAQLLYFCCTGSDPVPLDDSNSTTLQRRVLQWSSGEAAHGVSEIYRKCSHRDPRERIKYISDVGDLLAAIIIALRGSRANTILDNAHFLGEVRFSMSGTYAHCHEESSVRFMSRSGRTGVTLSVQEAAQDPGDSDVDVLSLEACFDSRHGLAAEGLSNEQVRITLNTWIDQSLRAYPFARRKSGSLGTYQVYVNMDKLKNNMEGVMQCRTVMSRVIELIERA
jgi:serine/threonine protein kinase